MEKKYILPLFEVTPQEAEKILSTSGSELRAMVDSISKMILEKKPTPAQAVAILVRALACIEENCCLKQKD